jgi:hypothetical protein
VGSYLDGSGPGPFAGGGGMPGSVGRPAAGFMSLQTSSFADVLASYSPELLPGRAPGSGLAGPPGQAVPDLPHATTIVAAVCDHGVVLAGDRREHDREAGRGEGLPQR